MGKQLGTTAKRYGVERQKLRITVENGCCIHPG
jgi:hypothetical protein